MTLVVHTARVSYGGPDRLDVTRKSAGPEGIAFAPSWGILRPALALLGLARGMREVPLAAAHAAELAGSAWALYAEAYRAEMRVSYREQRPAWDALLARERATLVCYCADPHRCHRRLLAQILATLGARDAGEVHGG